MSRPLKRPRVDAVRQVHDAVPPIAMRIDRVAELTGYSRSFLYPFIKTGELASFRDGGKRLVLYEDVRAFVARRAALARTSA